MAGDTVEGSTAEAVAAVAKAPDGRDLAAAVVLRSLDAGVIAEGKQDTLARSVVSLCEVGLPKLCEFVGMQPKAQNYEKLEKLRGAHRSIVKLLEPLGTPYASLDTLVGAKSRLTGALQHSMVRAYCRPWHVVEVAEVVDHLTSSLARVLKMDSGFESDLEASRQEITRGSATSHACSSEVSCALDTSRVFRPLLRRATVLRDIHARRDSSRPQNPPCLKAF